jgi:SAM-dependent methyltransferase
VPPAESWHSGPTGRYATASPSTFRPTPVFANSHYPREEYYTRGSSPSSSLAPHINTMSISSERTLAHSPLVLYPDSRTGFLVSKSAGSFLSQSPPRTDHSSSPGLVYPGFSNASDMSSAGSVAGNTPPSIQSFSSDSNSERSGRHFSHQPGFVYPSSRSVGRPTPGGPKFRLRSKSNAKAKGSDNTPSIPAGLAGSAAGPSSVSAASVKSPRPSISTSTPSSGSTEPFVFPTTRSRAHPNSTPRNFRKKKDDSAEGNRNAKEFMGVPFKFRKKKTNAHFPQAPSDDVAAPSPIAVESEYIPAPAPAQNIEAPASLLPPKIGAYPLDPYDSALLENDKHTYTLLRRLNWTDTPSFCLWAHDPPSSVLDLGSGQGHWILEAAIYWKGYGTRFTALDIADTMKFLRPLALKNGVADSIKFVRSNFLKQPLPFDDESFDLVRMSNLTYAISYDKWNFILEEVCRVLTVGGRLEFIDDHIFFPYGKDLRTPSASLSQMMNGPQHADRPPSIQQNDTDSNDVYRFSTDTEGEASHVLSGNSVGSPPGQYVAPGTLDIESQFWNEQVNASQELESVFEDMMKYKFGIHLCPSQFISEMLTQIFGYSRKVKTLHLTIAPSHLPEQAFGADTSPVDSKGPPVDQPNVNRFPSTSREADVSHASAEICDDLFENSPGLVIWPSTLVPMPLSELQMHALKHPRTLLSCKPGLAEFAKETLDVNPEDDVVQEALWEYESSFATRFNPPPQRAEGVNIPLSTSPIADNRSILSIHSISSETRSALWDYDSELRTHLASPAGASFVNEPRSTNSSSPRPFASEVPSEPQSHEAVGMQHENTSISSASDLPSFSSHPPFVAQGQGRESMAPPDYCATEPIHVRTFHIYEAIKMEQGLVSSN